MLRTRPVFGAALVDVSLSVEAGELVAVMGPSSSGKTTLLSLAGGLDLPTSGSIYVDGFDLAALNHAELARLRRHETSSAAVKPGIKLNC